MYIVIVDIVVRPEFTRAFLVKMVANARTSRESEMGCRQFDVSCAPENSQIIFLYEAYDDKAAFDTHLQSQHFMEFSEATTAWVESKEVRTLHRIDPT